MTEKKNLKAMLIVSILVIVAGFLIYALFGIVVLNSEKILATSYSNEKLISTINDLIESKAIYADPEGIIQMDASKINHLNKDLTAAVKREMKHVKMSKNGLFFDKMSVAISSRKSGYAVGAEIIKRGTILDRHGRPLAETKIDPQTLSANRVSFGESVFHPGGFYGDGIYEQRGIELIYDEVLKTGFNHAPIRKSAGIGANSIIYGDDIQLTLDAELNKATYDILVQNAFKSAVVVIDVEKSEILAMASAPSIDPNSKDANHINRVTDDPNRPGDNRALMTFPLGSVAKIATSIAWLESAGFDPSLKVECRCEKSRPVPCWSEYGHGTIMLVKGFSESCNAVFAKLGIILGKALGETHERLGLTHRISLGPKTATGKYIFAEAGKSFPKGFDFKHNPKISAQVSVGQNVHEATPIHIAMLVQAVINGGVMITPSLIREIRDANGVVRYKAPIIKKRIMSKNTARQLESMMEKFMTDGTGKKIEKIYRLPNGKYSNQGSAGAQLVRIAGKTGTAQNASGPVHSWFVGFAPADNPKFVVCVLAENAGGSGAAIAGPMANKILIEALNRYQ
jgi:peptidoglycan glycosyltransferase